MYTKSFDEIYAGIKKAVEIEKKKQFINVEGRYSTFSKFVLNNLKDFRKLLSKPDRLKLENLYISFEQYEFDSLNQRMKAVELLIETFADYKKIKEKKKKSSKNKILNTNKLKKKMIP